MSPSTISPWLQLLQGLLTPVIGVIALYIAWQQWQGNKVKLVLDHYDRRLRVYQSVVGFLRLVLRDSKPEISELMKFPLDTAEAAFLFPPEIPEYLDEMFKRGLKLRQAAKEYRDMFQPVPEGYDHGKVVANMQEQEVWFTNQLLAVKEKFKEYLDLSR